MPDFVFGPLDDDLSETVLRWRNDDGIRRYMYHDRVISESEHRSWYESVRVNPTKKFWIMHADGKPAGLLNLTAIDSDNKCCEWAFYIGDPAAQKLGLGRVAEFHTLDHVFLTLGLDKLNCAVLDFNKAVVNMHKSFGFSDEGFLRSQIKKPEGRCGVHLLGMTRSEWLAGRASVFARKMAPLGPYSFRYADGSPVHPLDASQEIR